MAAVESSMIRLGTKAPSFELINTINTKKLSLENAKGEKGTVVMFICNHCPYVIHVIETLVSLANKYKKQGINFIGISSNDIVNYPADSPEKMKEFAVQYSIPFPYLYDQTQDIAKAYNAECTPDIYLFNEELKLVYRGRIDETRPKKGVNAHGADLNGALSAVASGQFVSEIQYPSIGCSIKWL